MSILSPTSSVSALFPHREKFPSDDTVFPISWYPIAWASQLKDKPVKRRVVGRDVVVYRDSKGQIHALEAYCAHRGADLSLGKCVADGIQCAYHGWQFNAEGHCTKIPAHPNRPIPEFAKIRAYPVQERAGLIWIYPDDLDVPPDLKLFSELEQPELVLVPYEQTWKAHLTRVVESVLDVAHLAFVHKSTIGKRLSEEIKLVDFDVQEQNQIVIRNGGGLLEYQFPQQWILRPSTPSKSQFINYVTFCPVDSDTTIIFGYAGRTFLRKMPFMNPIFRRYSLKVLTEDKAVVESQHPRPIPEALRMEAHVPADGPQVRFRQRWFQFLASEEPRIILHPGSSQPEKTGGQVVGEPHAPSSHTLS
ncbi:aromatic ring-hydroxylating dioxygenase subunit alpha [Alicyclobacillus sp. SP_1]|uniref:aromatic ring-hydroxylating oxygenase subunit alpha n=1 Tax=Alicyclobacillus sp. SP_1 TaxID=2942475 RepID=UPI002157339B|nr:aromatic ring-hydroxylating dioxygenase subunit alpha [Alicyclobacillus sp. SP_1]